LHFVRAVIDKEDVLDNPLISPFAVFIKGILILDLDIEVLVLKILSNNLDLFLLSKFTPYLYLPIKIIIIFSSKC
jgi:hypothetical protein